MNPGLVLGIVGSLIAVWVVFLLIFWVLRPKGASMMELVRLVPDVLRMLRRLAGDSEVALDARVVVVAMLAWLISPIDLIPDFIPVIGPIDDVVVAIAALRYVRRRVGVAGLRERWSGTDEGFALLGRVVGFGSAD